MFTPATKLIIITEHFLCRKICTLIENAGAKGYTLVPAGGKGLHHLHPTLDQATVVEGFDNLKIEVICKDRALAESLATRILEDCFEDHPGIIYLENVEVCRPQRF